MSYFRLVRVAYLTVSVFYFPSTEVAICSPRLPIFTNHMLPYYKQQRRVFNKTVVKASWVGCWQSSAAEIWTQHARMHTRPKLSNFDVSISKLNLQNSVFSRRNLELTGGFEASWDFFFLHGIQRGLYQCILCRLKEKICLFICNNQQVFKVNRCERTTQWTRLKCI